MGEKRRWAVAGPFADRYAGRAAHTMVSALRRKGLQKVLPTPASSLWVNDRPRYGRIGEEGLRAGLDWEEKSVYESNF